MKNGPARARALLEEARTGQYGKAMEALMRFAGTPSFVIGSRLYPGVPDEKRLKEAIAMARG